MSDSQFTPGSLWGKVKSRSRPRAHRKAGSPIQVVERTLPTGMVGSRYDTQLTVRGGITSHSYQWETVKGAAPPGLLLSQNGTISGNPKSDGITRFTVQATGVTGEKSDPQDLSITISQKLAIANDLSRQQGRPGTAEDFIADLHAEGGTSPYKWELASRSALPDGIDLEENGRIHKTANPDIRGTMRFTVRATDQEGYTDTSDFFIKASRPSRVWGRHRSTGNPRIAALSIMVRPSLRRILFHTSNYLALLVIGLLSLGSALILIYAFATPGGSSLGYLSVGLLTALAAFLIGGLGGFLFGIPRMVSSGSLRHEAGPEYAPSSNLAEVSDWLTKLLLGAGLVQLTHLGAPVANLIDHVAHGLYALPASKEAAQVMAGAILFGYTAIGLLAGYVEGYSAGSVEVQSYYG
jgi:Putative Ig domain